MLITRLTHATASSTSGAVLPSEPSWSQCSRCHRVHQVRQQPDRLTAVELVFDYLDQRARQRAHRRRFSATSARDRASGKGPAQTPPAFLSHMPDAARVAVVDRRRVDVSTARVRSRVIRLGLPKASVSGRASRCRVSLGARGARLVSLLAGCQVVGRAQVQPDREGFR